MKKTILRMIAATLLLLASASTPVLADGGLPVPFCPPGATCP